MVTRLVVCIMALLLAAGPSAAYDKAACDAVMQRASGAMSSLVKVFQEIQGTLTAMDCSGKLDGLLSQYLVVIEENSALRAEATKVCDLPPIDYRQAQQQNIATIRNHIAYCKKERPR